MTPGHVKCSSQSCGTVMQAALSLPLRQVHPYKCFYYGLMVLFIIQLISSHTLLHYFNDLSGNQVFDIKMPFWFSGYSFLVHIIVGASHSKFSFLIIHIHITGFNFSPSYQMKLESCLDQAITSSRQGGHFTTPARAGATGQTDG